jgi:hypothetical protein
MDIVYKCNYKCKIAEIFDKIEVLQTLMNNYIVDFSDTIILC